MFIFAIFSLFLVVFGSADSFCAEGESLLQKGIKYGKIKEYGKAIEVFNQVLEEDPMNESAQFFLAISQWKTGRKEAARGSYQAVRILNSTLAGKLEKMFPEIAYQPPIEPAQPRSSGDSSYPGLPSSFSSKDPSPPPTKELPKEELSEEELPKEELSEEELSYQKVEDGWKMTESSIPSTVESGYRQILRYEPDNFRAMEGMRDHLIEHGTGGAVRDQIRKMAKAGHISWDECDQQINDYHETHKK
ncbi:MAG: bacterial transcriptional activator domain-containing protein [Candidatus Riflebacteria bacterium]|nr:bacterial transcriptional activator domain-containing protein [Candidatus Riflebacteria bacterium]